MTSDIQPTGKEWLVIVDWRKTVNTDFVNAFVVWTTLLALLTLAGFISPIGTFGRWAAPYLLSAVTGILMACVSGYIAVWMSSLILTHS